MFGIGGNEPQIVGEDLGQPPPLHDQDISLEFGETAFPSALTLCDVPNPVVIFEGPVQEQIYRVMEGYRMGLTDELRRLTASTIVAEAERYGLDPWLVVGLIRVESAFYNYAVSNKNAMGLMQILPYVGESVAADIGVDWNGAETLFHPVKNVKIGTAYLARLQKRFNGNQERALQAYNLGPTRLARWIRHGRDLPTEYSGAVEGFYDKYIGVADLPSEDVRVAVRRAERRYSREKRARVTAALATQAPAEAPEDLATALGAGVESVDGDPVEQTGGTVPTAPDAELAGAAFEDDASAGAAFDDSEAGAAYGDDGPSGGAAIMAPPLDALDDGILTPPGWTPPLFE